jgi:hypothetical protein
MNNEQKAINALTNAENKTIHVNIVTIMEIVRDACSALAKASILLENGSLINITPELQTKINERTEANEQYFNNQYLNRKP